MIVNANLDMPMYPLVFIPAKRIRYIEDMYRPCTLVIGVISELFWFGGYYRAPIHISGHGKWKTVLSYAVVQETHYFKKKYRSPILATGSVLSYQDHKVVLVSPLCFRQEEESVHEYGPYIIASPAN